MVHDLQAARDREKAFFLSSRRARTPLTAIRVYAELSPRNDAPYETCRDVMLGESQRLERLVQDLLDLGRLESGEFSITARMPTCPRSVWPSSTLCNPAAKQVGVILDLETDGPSVVHTDPDRVQQ